MNAKADILAKIRSQTVPPVELPSHAGPWIQYENPLQQFAEVLKFVGGESIEATGIDSLRAAIQGLPCLADAKNIVCQIAGLEDLQTFDLNAVADPHAVDAVDVAILPGEFGVAENAAIWVDDRQVKHRVVYFLTQHLILVLPKQSLVQNLYEAYQRLQFAERGYGLFISGPSKTADIEQSLVIGAHGPKSLTVLLVD